MTRACVDPCFALPALAERAVVLGGLDTWVEALQGAGFAVSEYVSANAVPELVVAPAELAADAIDARAEMVLLQGRGAARVLRRAGLHVSRLLPIPSLEAPRHLVQVEHGRAAVHAVEHCSVPNGLSKRLRNAVAKGLLGRGRFPDLLPAYTIGVRGETAPTPFLLAAARELGIASAEWYLTLGGFDGLSRSAFHVFPRGGAEPEWVVKFTRVRGYSAPFEQDERGLRLVRSAGAWVGRRVPELVGRLELGGFHASVETAAHGYRLSDLLQRSIPRDEKLRVIDSIAAWILELGGRTARNSSSLQQERDRLVADVLPRWAGHGVSSRLVDRLPPLPSVLQHANVGTWNVVARGPGEFTVIDWESARTGSFPLWDLIFFLADALLQLEGAATNEERDRTTARLFRGELPSSGTLFRWVRRAVRSFGLPPESVGAITTLCWLDHGAAGASRTSARSVLAGGDAWGDDVVGRVATVWLREPGLGVGWEAWRAA